PKPTFRRHLLFASILFITLFVADLFVVGHLAFRDLGHRVIDQALRASLRILENRSAMPVLPDGNEAESVPPPAEPCPPGDPESRDLVQPCIALPADRSPAPRIFRALRYRWQRVITDLQGRVLWVGFG